jgi:hypothetical protein
MHPMLFETFKEEHMEPPSLPRYTTRYRAHQNSADKAQHHAPRVFSPITFTNTQVFHAAPKQAIKQIPLANYVLNQDTGISLEHRQLIQDETILPVWKKSAAHEFGRLAQGVGGRLEGSNTMIQHNLLYPTPRNTKRKNCHLWPFCGGYLSQQS